MNYVEKLQKSVNCHKGKVHGSLPVHMLIVQGRPDSAPGPILFIQESLNFPGENTRSLYEREMSTVFQYNQF